MVAIVASALAEMSAIDAGNRSLGVFSSNNWENSNSLQRMYFILKVLIKILNMFVNESYLNLK